MGRGRHYRALAAALFALPLSGCLAFSWRAGGGLVATTEPGLAGEVFVGGAIGVGVMPGGAIETGARVDAVVQIRPARAGVGLDESLAFRKESEDGLPGWRVGLETGARSLFGRTETGWINVDGLFDLLFVLGGANDGAWKHIGLGLRAGVTPSGGDSLGGHFETLVFYEAVKMVGPEIGPAPYVLLPRPAPRPQRR